MRRLSLSFSRPRWLVLLLLGALLPLWAAAPASSTGAPRATGDATSVAARRAPAQDFPRMPRACATPQEKIPQHPIICHLDGFHRGWPTVVLWGDSHAWMFLPALRRAARGHHVNLVASMMGSCPPMAKHRHGAGAPACVRSNAKALRYVRHLQRGPQRVRVVLGSSWQRYLHALEVGDHHSYVGAMARLFERGTPRLFRLLGRDHIATDAIGQVATVPEHRPRCRRGNLPYSCDLRRHAALPEPVVTRTWLRRAMRPLAGDAPALWVDERFCNARVCHGMVDGIHTWFDDFHLSATRSRTLWRFLAPTIRRVTS